MAIPATSLYTQMMAYRHEWGHGGVALLPLELLRPACATTLKRRGGHGPTARIPAADARVARLGGGFVGRQVDGGRGRGRGRGLGQGKLGTCTREVENRGRDMT